MRRQVMFLALLFSGVAWASESPDSILKRADEIRNPSESYFMKVEVENLGEEAGQASAFEVSLQSEGEANRTLVRTLEPARDRGRDLLMLNEEMWAYVPNLKRSIRVSLNQKLTGQAANGDISRMRWSGDYDPAIESQTEKEWVLFLKGRKKGLTYDQLRVWVEKATNRPLRAEFLAVSGKILKKASYEGYKEMAGKTRPSEILIQDAVRESDRSRIKIVQLENKKFPPSIFNQTSLGQ